MGIARCAGVDCVAWGGAMSRSKSPLSRALRTYSYPRGRLCYCVGQSWASEGRIEVAVVSTDAGHRTSFICLVSVALADTATRPRLYAIGCARLQGCVCGHIPD